MTLRLTSMCCVVTLCAALSLAATAPPISDEQAAAQALALAQARLKLTPEQTEQVRPLMLAQVVKLRGLFTEYTGEGASVLPSFLQEFQKAREDFRAAVLPILTGPQKGAFDQLRKEVDAALRDEVCSQRIALLKGRLGLTPDQETRLRPILSDDFEKKRTLLALNTSSAAGGPGLRRPINDEVQKVQAATEARLASVFTPEQMKTYRADRDAKAAAAKN